MPKVNERDIFEIKEWLNDTPQNVEEYEKMVGGSAPSGTIEISANGEYDVSEYATAKVEVEGGGGSSDFSTATVTFIGSSSIEEVRILGALTQQPAPPFIPEAQSVGWKYVYADETYNLSVILYKGQALLTYSGATTAVASGDISIGGDNITVTGDGTVTFA